MNHYLLFLQMLDAAHAKYSNEEKENYFLVTVFGGMYEVNDDDCLYFRFNKDYSILKIL